MSAADAPPDDLTGASPAAVTEARPAPPSAHVAPSAPPLSGRALLLRGLGKRFDAVQAVRDVSLDVGRGQFLTLLGPSGSGKTTLLMMLAGFVRPDSGRIFLDEHDITAVPPERRDFGMVFQGYALFPNLSVAENVAFPLRVRRLGRAEREERVRAALDLVQLAGLGERMPHQLSGGQQQRVALARALVFDPAVILLDEPLSALDRKLRGELQEELRALHRRVGRTFVAVTHDQEEALSMSDRVAVLDRGRLVQDGSPAELYERPCNRFVAGFLGESNFLAGRIERTDGRAVLVRIGPHLVLASGRAGAGEAVTLSLRPERIAVQPVGSLPPPRDAPAALPPEDFALRGDNAVAGAVRSVSFLGAERALVVHTDDFGPLRVRLPAWGPVAPAEGDLVRLVFPHSAALVVSDDG